MRRLSSPVSFASLVLAILGLVVMLAACASTSPHQARTTHTPTPSAPRCPGGSPVGCITTPECQYDEARQCEACICAPAFRTVQQTQVAPFSAP